MTLQSLCEQAVALQQQGRLAQAEPLCARILEAEPANVTARHLLGLIRFQQGRIADALDMIAAALAAKPDAAELLIHHGFMLQAAQRFEEALASYDKALAIVPGDDYALYNRGEILIRMERFEEALACYDGVLAIRPGLAIARNNHGAALMGLGRFGDALADFDAALATQPSLVPALNNRGKALVKLGRPQEALASFEKALAIEPGLAETLANRGNALKQLNRFEDALASYEAVLASDPANTDAKYEKAVALVRLGRAAEAQPLMALDRLIWIDELPTSPGYKNGEAFRAALMDDIRANPTLLPDPRGKATRDGLQTRQLRQPGAHAVEALLPQLHQGVEKFIAALEARQDPFLEGRPAEMRIEIWAVVYGGEGQQLPHRHPSGWISGVFYVAAPRPNGSNSYRGPLVLGPTEGLAEPPWGAREVEPVPGRLVLFPSYFPHATQPSGIDGARISIAFDMVPMPKMAT